MSAIYFLIGCSVVIALIFLIAFFWANKDGQHDDTYTPAIRILFEEESKAVNTAVSEKTEEREKLCQNAPEPTKTGI